MKVKTTAVIADSSDSVNLEFDEEEAGLFWPPMDEGAFDVIDISSTDLSKFFDGIDDDGNLEKNVEFKSLENRKTSPLKNLQIPKTVIKLKLKNKINKEMNVQQKPGPVVKEKIDYSDEAAIRMKLEASKRKISEGYQRAENDLQKNVEFKSIENGKTSPPKDLKIPITDSRPKTVLKLKLKHKISKEMNVQQKPGPVVKEKIDYSDEAAIRMKLEATKRKIREGYQRAENAKKQRTTKLLDIKDLPKLSGPHMRILQGNGKKIHHVRTVSCIRQRMNGR